MLLFPTPNYIDYSIWNNKTDVTSTFVTYRTIPYDLDIQKSIIVPKIDRTLSILGTTKIAYKENLKFTRSGTEPVRVDNRR